MVRVCFLNSVIYFYSQSVMDETADLKGMKVGGVNINNIRYADDMVLIADTEEKLQRLVDRLD